MLYNFEPRKSYYYSASAYNGQIEIDGRKLTNLEPMDLSEEEVKVIESLYPGSLELVEGSTDAGKGKAETKSSTGKKPANAERNRDIDSINSGKLNLSELEAILDKYPGDSEIESFIQTAMSKAE
jgi:DUF438 domain-containing protein